MAFTYSSGYEYPGLPRQVDGRRLKLAIDGPIQSKELGVEQKRLDGKNDTRQYSFPFVLFTCLSVLLYIHT